MDEVLGRIKPWRRGQGIARDGESPHFRSSQRMLWGEFVNKGKEADVSSAGVDAHAESSDCVSKELKKQLREVWVDVLGHDDFDDDVSFFEVGGHSVKATLMLIKLRRRVGVLLSVRQVFDHPTIRELAVVVESKIATTVSAVE